MGHIRLKRLPATRKWQQVVALLASGAPVEDIAGASADAADGALRSARNDPALAHTFWLLTQIPLAARAPDSARATRELGLNIGVDPSLMEVVSAFSEAVDRATIGRSARTDLGEMALPTFTPCRAARVEGYGVRALREAGRGSALKLEIPT